jgi:phage terminase large subunit
LNIKFPEIFKPLFQQYRYVVYYGGRGAGKSWAFARVLLTLGCTRTIRVLCAREIQRSIADSVHRLLEDQIDELGKIVPQIAENYAVTKSEIKGKNGTTFSFIGLYTNQNQIKSYEGVDYCWIEEAESISQKSWDLLMPTIRRKGSQIWISFNPARDDDPTYEMFIREKQVNAYVKKITFRDNKYFGEPLLSEMELCKKTNYSKYMHIWEGEPITDYESLVYRFRRGTNLTKKELKYNAGFETFTSWDFGVGDDTAIIFYQVVSTPDLEQFPLGFIIYIFDEYSNNNKKASHYREVVDSKRYLIDRHYCDPSGANRESDLSSWLDKLKYAKDGRNEWHFEYTHRFSPTEMIDAANDVIMHVRVNRHQCPGVVKMFEHWQYRTDKDGKVISPAKPQHDEFSHYGTSFYYMVANRFPSKKKASIQILK